MGYFESKNAFIRAALSLMADAVDFFLDGEFVETGQGQTQEQADPAIQNHEGLAECLLESAQVCPATAAGSGTPQ